MKKVLLLCGPPGTGKTTLAHVIASHAGYNSIEINARFYQF
jgi:chromosome transmission fidelity protein 18